MADPTVASEKRPPTEAERAAAADKAHAEAKKNQEAAMTANSEAAKLRTQATEDRAKADAETDPAKKPALEKTARESAQKADDALAKAAEADRKARGSIAPMTVDEAKIMAPVDPAMPASHHLAQKFGNDPSNPKPALGISTEPQHATVRLSRKSPDHPDLVHTQCHPDMVGDYLRAGWNVDEVQPGVAYATDPAKAPSPPVRATG